MISFSSSALVDRPFDWAYQLEDLGYTGWEIVCEGMQRLTEDNVDEARRIAETTDLVITLHLPYSDLNLASVNQPIWEESVRQMKSCLTLAADFTELAVVHPGHLSPLGAQVPERAWEQNILGIRSICDHAEDLGITIAVENMVNIPTLLGRAPFEIVGIMDTVDRENLGFTLDVGHANTNGNLKEFLQLRERITHIHIHDNHGERDEHLPVGSGTVDWRLVFSSLNGYRGRYVTEARSLVQGQTSLSRIKMLM
ncbi:MAG: sugar phosphate isomerase/epimerase [Methanothrix sp.]|jgi:sugar phosphate isomerase/epimerase|uniref:Xylose isomerase domain protein TIM barrel n=1 Tax=Methanothrix thermoacetophila (strain DSM 6194 / JCM 14653 / NBRC 101360 / PT) TaxID=349307 RepID=A0B630_METTP|nr:sugar phosphate isomerase/epimerase family protein [Methanothrix thermoacetophila]ABK14154.1 Xylose isomerase domain protein TIM barrel [Methanothrix thermoacetophila PT]MBC7079747.1 sugar phosphate isomerase/epimerase [Methanothrix sp.]